MLKDKAAPVGTEEACAADIKRSGETSQTSDKHPLHNRTLAFLISATASKRPLQIRPENIQIAYQTHVDQEPEENCFFGHGQVHYVLLGWIDFLRFFLRHTDTSVRSLINPHPIFSLDCSLVWLT
uniref:Uncharacterized protein n=1 Tax=Macrostomum lignano TaxID=282301 RepID=A0A1I8FL06_9PLAT